MEETVGSRIALLRKKIGYTQKALGTKVGVTNVTVSLWENNTQEPRGRNMDHLCQALNTTIAYILHGKTGYSSTSEPVVNYDAGGMHTSKRVPMISWRDAFTFALDMSQDITDESVESWITIAQPCGSKTFALKIFGNSMASPDGLSVPQDYIIIVDPDEAENAVHDDLIVAVNDIALIFRQFQTDGFDRWLKPLNPRNPDLHGKFTIVGKVIYAGMDL